MKDEEPIVETPEVEVPETPIEEPKEDLVDPPIDVDKLEIKTRERKEEKIEYGDDIDPTDADTIGKIVAKQTEGVKKALQEQQDRMEIDSFVAERPEFAKYKPAILKYMYHVDSNTGKKPFENTSIRDIAFAVAGDDLLKLGAKREREAQAKANATKGGGTPTRSAAGGQTDWNNAPKDAFEAQKRQVLGQR